MIGRTRMFAAFPIIMALLFMALGAPPAHADSGETDLEGDGNVTFSAGWFHTGITVPFTNAPYTLLTMQSNIGNGGLQIFLDGRLVAQDSPPPAGEITIHYSFLSDDTAQHNVTFLSSGGAQTSIAYYRISGHKVRVRGGPYFPVQTHDWWSAPNVIPVDGRSVLGVYRELFNSAIGGMITYVIGFSIVMMALSWIINVFKQIAGGGARTGGGQGGGTTRAEKENKKEPA